MPCNGIDSIRNSGGTGIGKGTSDVHMRPSRPRLFSLRRTIVLGGVLALVAGFFLFGSGGYILRAALEEASILARRKPIPAVIAAPATPPETRGKLQLVLEARSFAADQLGLDAGDSYTTFSPVDRDTLLLVLQASRKDAFEPVTWWFPIVGRIPYKGFFDHEAALAAARKLDTRGTTPTCARRGHSARSAGSTIRC